MTNKEIALTSYYAKLIKRGIPIEVPDKYKDLVQEKVKEFNETDQNPVKSEKQIEHVNSVIKIHHSQK